MDHDHASDLKEVSKKRLWIAFYLTLFYMFVEIIMGGITNSLSLLSDAGHMFNDAFSIALALLALRLSLVKVSYGRTFGFKRVEVISALINGLSLLFISGYIIKESIKRFTTIEDVTIQGDLLLLTAFFGLIVNFGSFYVLRSVKEKSMNVEGAYLHVISDLLGSLGAIISGVGIMLWNLYILDLISSVVISVLILRSALPIVIKASRILLEASPTGINIEDLINDLRDIEGVYDVHDFHSWRVTDGFDLVTAHLYVSRESDYESIVKQCTVLCESYNFQHSTFQLDFEPCLFNCIPSS